MAELRMGMWVKANGKPGIVTSLDPLRVDLVDAKGNTIESASPSSAMQAKLRDIPASRRPAADRAKALGYA